MIVIYEYYYENLLNEYQKRKHQNIKFKESEILYLIQSIVDGLQSMNSVHGQLNLETILLKQNEEVVIFNHSFLSMFSEQEVDQISRSRQFKEKYLYS